MTSLTRTPALLAEDISFSFGRKQILRRLSLQAMPGECVGIAGVNGSGKSTLLSVLAGVRKADLGELICYGHPMFRERKRFPRLIGYVPQDDPLLEELTVLDNLALWSTHAVTGQEAVIRQLGFSDSLNDTVRRLSGGTKRRLAIACALINDQPVLIMDEPTAALDIRQRDIVHRFIRAHADRGGVVLMATHDREEMDLCDRLYFLQDGMCGQAAAEEIIRLIRGRGTPDAAGRYKRETVDPQTERKNDE